jgi:hypothetical protein
MLKEGLGLLELSGDTRRDGVSDSVGSDATLDKVKSSGVFAKGAN